MSAASTPHQPPLHRQTPAQPQVGEQTAQADREIEQEAAQKAQSLPADVPPPPPQHAPRWEHDQWRQRHQERLTRHQQEVRRWRQHLPRLKNCYVLLALVHLTAGGNDTWPHHSWSKQRRQERPMQGPAGVDGHLGLHFMMKLCWLPIWQHRQQASWESSGEMS